jgi:hypothetical protein
MNIGFCANTPLSCHLFAVDEVGVELPKRETLGLLRSQKML